MASSMELMELSLDEIISESNRTGRGGSGRRGRGRGGYGRGRGSFPKNRGVYRGDRVPRSEKFSVPRGRGRWSWQPARNSNVNGDWSHDKFRNDNAGFSGLPIPAKAVDLETEVTSSGPAQITISNLHFGVSEEDILELFGELGRIRFTSLHYDRKGKRMGKADVVYQNHSEAELAIKLYNGVPLDGREMIVAFTRDADATAAMELSPPSPQPVLRQLQSDRVSRAPIGIGHSKVYRGPRDFRGRGRGGRDGKRGGKHLKTAAQLDAELDAYIRAKPKDKFGKFL